jgi:uncharacterized protein (TIGR02996 family)
MPTERELLEAVLANPRDDAPRLVYADWLSERGDRRGELIAMQIKEPYGDAEPTADEEAAWSGCLPSMKPGVLGWSFERGFVSQIRTQGWGWIGRAAEIFAEHPVEEIVVAGVGNDNREGMTALAAAPWAEKIKKLLIGASGQIRGRDLKLLLDAPGFAPENLGVFTTLDVPAAKVIARWHGLTSLSVSTPELGLVQALWIAKSKALATVKRLQIARLPVPADAEKLLATLAGNKHIGALTHLYLGGNRLAMSSLGDLLARFSDLTHLGLSDVGMTDPGAEVLASLPGLEGVIVLGLDRNRIGDAGARAIAASPHLDELEDLSLAENPIKGKAALRARFGKRVSF